jgi:RNA polymerase sigma factor (sigma-70 family)
MSTPFASTPDAETDDQLISDSRAGDRDALDALVVRHQPWVLNLSVRMLYRREDAEDATQEILLKAFKALPSFRGDSKFSTWLYRIAVNHLLTVRTEKWAAADAVCSFSAAAAGLQRVPDLDLPDPATVPVPVELLVNEVAAACTIGTLLCLDGRQRLVFILAVVLGLDDDAGAEIAEVTPANFRQILSRARRDLAEYLRGNCSLVEPNNACTCSRKTRAYIQGGLVDPGNLRFAAGHLRRVRDVVAGRPDTSVEAYVNAACDIYRGHPFVESPGQLEKVLQLLRSQASAE